MDIVERDMTILCQCKTADHLLVIKASKYEENDNEFSIHINLNPYLPFWRRIIVGIKYIFGYRADNMCNFDNVIVEYDDLKQLKEIIKWHLNE